jgi:hypothetical protein
LKKLKKLFRSKTWNWNNVRYKKLQ